MADKKVIVGGVLVAVTGGIVALASISKEKITLSGPSSAILDVAATYTVSVMKGSSAQSGVSVTLDMDGTTYDQQSTDKSGSATFTVKFSSTGSHTLQASTSSTTSSKLTVTVTDVASKVKWSVTPSVLSVAGGTITVSGTVTDDAGNKFQGYTLGVFVDGTQQGSSQTSDKNGSFTFTLKLPKNNTSSKESYTITLQGVS